MGDAAKRLAQRQHDSLCRPPEGCLAEVERDRAHVPDGDYQQFMCPLCRWTGRVSGLALAAARVRAAE